KVFKERLLYPSSKPFRVESEITTYFDMRMKDNDWSKFQAAIFLDDGIYSLACLPAAGHSGTYPSASKLLSFYKGVLEDILAFTCNKLVDEYSVLFTDMTNEAIKKKIINVFIK